MQFVGIIGTGQGSIDEYLFTNQSFLLEKQPKARAL